MSEIGQPEDVHPYDVLHKRARDWLRTRKLPRARPSALYAGYGSQQQKCLLCTAPISDSQVEYELVFDAAGETPPRQFTIHLHLPCHAIYEYERVRFDGE